MRRMMIAMAALVALTGAAPSPEALRELAPSGRIRVAINYSNAVLAQQDPATGEPRGVSVELGRELGREIGLPVEFVVFNEAGQVSASASLDRWDVGFLAIDPVRAQGIDFTAPYVLIEGTYLVPDGSALRTIGDVDRDGMRIGVAKDSAYDLFLTRDLKHATLVRGANAAATYQDLSDGRIDVVAGVRQSLVGHAASHPQVRVMDGRFMSIEQAMCVPKGRAEALRYLKGFVEARKASGFVAEKLRATGQSSAAVAPPASN